MTNNTVEINLITVTRDDLFDLSHVLSQATKAVFPDTRKSLNMSVRGSYSSGKSIIPEIIREDIFGEACDNNVSGLKDHDEYWVREINGETCEFDYFDLAWISYNRKELQKDVYAEREKASFALRQHPGITVIQNKRNDNDVDINIWVEKVDGAIVGFDADDQASIRINGMCRLNASGFRQELMKAEKIDPWARYVSVAFNAELVSDTPELRKVIDILSEQAAAVKKELECFTHGDAHDGRKTISLRAQKYFSKRSGP